MKLSATNSSSDQIRRCHTYANVESLVMDRAAALGEIANTAIANNGLFKFVLAGGRTPVKLYRQLISLQTDWSRWIIYFGDERCLPRGDDERNDTMAANEWLNHVAISAAHIHAIPAELGPQAGALAYIETLKAAGQFDLVLLGLGEDGHTASLFPQHPFPQQLSSENFIAADAAIPVHDAPKPPPQRISLSPQRLSDAQHVWFLVTGADKQTALTDWLNNKPIPANLIQPSNGVDIFTELNLKEIAH